MGHSDGVIAGVILKRPPGTHELPCWDNAKLSPESLSKLNHTFRGWKCYHQVVVGAGLRPTSRISGRAKPTRLLNLSMR